jgi:putative ABC transport system permease protein
MLKNIIKIFFRNMIKHPGYSISNISGLAVGMATCILILFFVRYELNWNTYNKKYNRTYRVQQKVLFKNDYSIYGQTGYILASELQKQIPEIENASVTGYIYDEYLSSSDDRTFNEKYGCYADDNIFKVLTFEFLKGNPETALSEPFSIVLTEQLAQKYFPGQSAIGKILKASKNKSLKVTGIVKDLPYNLDYRPHYLVSALTYKEVTDWQDFDKSENIGSGIFFTLVTLKPNISVKTVNDKIYNFADNYVVNNYKKLYLKPFSELHLSADEKNDIKIAVYYICLFAIFVLILACFNFINLSTANSFLRKKEIGVRKVVGASKSSLFIQFIGESLLFAIISMFLAFILVVLFLPSFNLIVSRHMDISFTKDINFILLMISVFILTGFLSGVYPAVYLSGFKPINVIKGNVSLFKSTKKGTSKSFLRKALVTAQFCISVMLLVSTVYVIKQVHFMKNKDLGFDKQDLLICYAYGTPGKGMFETLRNTLLINSNILDATVSTNAPFHGNWGKEMNWEGASITDKMQINFNKIDYNFINTYKMKMVLGRNLSKEFSDQQACLINETAWSDLKWDDPIGKKIDNNNYTIVGVVKDFHQYSVHVKIPAYYMVLNSGTLDDGGVFSVRIKPQDKEKTIAYVRGVFREYFPDAIIEATTFDNDMDFGTKGVWEIVEKLFIGFAIIAILIAANGLFGMISFSSQRRMKEIGIRKVFGAGSLQLYLLMSKEFTLILAFAALIALPSGYMIMRTTPGAYKYQMQYIDYFFAIGILTITAFAATLYHTTKAVLSNPVETLRYE